jgi:subtilisin family serine protease
VKSILLYIVLCLVILGCNSSKSTIKTSPNFKKQLSNAEWQDWQHKDISEDSIAGISLEKTYKELLQNKKGDAVIVAIVDMRIHKNHEDIKDFIWTNTDEIPNNGIDDDHNGYVDDIHGWNFLGNEKGEQAYRANFEYIRIIRKFDKIFKDKNREELDSTVHKDYDLYLKAKEAYNDELKYVRRRLRSLHYKKVRKNFLEKELAKIYPEEKISLETLQNIETTEEKVSQYIKDLIKLKKDSAKNASSFAVEKRYLDIYMNTDFPEREIIGDDVNDITDVAYGNNKITSDNSEGSHTHAIKVAGIIAANRNNKIGIKGITNQVKIMPVAISPYGDEQDKDMALGIRYAVDNGAKIINISSGKYFSLHKDWVIEALKYADKKDVLVVTSAGNQGYDIDKQENYPTDVNEDSKEIVNNLICVGSSSYSLDENVVSSTSNYGQKNVDIFAPGKDIYTTFPNNTYEFSSGTSLSAPMVSGVAALIYAHYPGFTAGEIKKIILDSGVSINWDVNKPPTRDNKELVPFSSLSKSGKIVNAYNALLLAEEISKKKKKNRKKKK